MASEMGHTGCGILEAHGSATPRMLLGDLTTCVGGWVGASAKCQQPGGLNVPQREVTIKYTQAGNTGPRERRRSLCFAVNIGSGNLL